MTFGPLVLRRDWRNQRMDAQRRGIEFLLSYEEWLDLWKASGHLDERGPRKGQYVMARNRDQGPYAAWNVRIVQSEENHAEHWARPGERERVAALVRGKPPTKAGKPVSEETRRKLSLVGKGRPAWNKGKKASEEARQKISQGLLGNRNTVGHKHSLEARKKMSASQTGKRHSEESKQRMAEVRRQYWRRRKCKTNTM